MRAGCSAPTPSPASPRYAGCSWSRWRRVRGRWPMSWPGADSIPGRTSERCWCRWRAMPPMTRCATRSPICGCGSGGWNSGGTAWRNCSATASPSSRRRRCPMPADDAYSAGPGASLAGQPAGGVIYDRGYRRYDGVRLGRLQIALALFWHSLRSSFGIGRGAKAKILPVIAFAGMCLPAAVNSVAVARGGPPVVFYGTYTFPLRVVVMTIFVAVQAPELVSRDLRSHVLPLYFCRPLRRRDYPAAKYAAFTVACLLMIEIPLLLLYLGNLVSAKGSSAVWLQTRLLAGGLGVGALWAVLLAAIGLALACLSAKRAYATGAVAIFFFLTWTLAQ